MLPAIPSYTTCITRVPHAQSSNADVKHLSVLQSEQTHLPSISKPAPSLSRVARKRTKSGFLELLAPALGGSAKLMNLLGAGDSSPDG